ncbi:hypothetical protein [Acetobacter pasteurianus]|nr:hypothetical protein [Acetobacter pasteurianus]
MLDRDVWQWSTKRKAWNDTVLHPNFVLPKNMAWRKYYGPVFSPTQINEMLAAERERCAVIADAKRDAVWDGKIGSLAKDKLRTGYAQAAITIGEAIRNLGDAP